MTELQGWTSENVETYDAQRRGRDRERKWEMLFQVGGQGTRPTFFEMSAAQQLPSSLRAALTYSLGVCFFLFSIFTFIFFCFALNTLFYWNIVCSFWKSISTDCWLVIGNECTIIDFEEMKRLNTNWKSILEPLVA